MGLSSKYCSKTNSIIIYNLSPDSFTHVHVILICSSSVVGAQILMIGISTAILSVMDPPQSGAEFHIPAVCGNQMRYWQWYYR